VMDFENPVAGTLFAVKELDDFQFDWAQTEAPKLTLRLPSRIIILKAINSSKTDPVDGSKASSCEKGKKRWEKNDAKDSETSFAIVKVNFLFLLTPFCVEILTLTMLSDIQIEASIADACRRHREEWLEVPRPTDKPNCMRTEPDEIMDESFCLMELLNPTKSLNSVTLGKL
jgi:hypothetical protein